MSTPSPELIRSWDRDAILELLRYYKTLSEESLRGLHDTFNRWDWPEEKLGSAPSGWDDMPNYRKPWMPEDTLTRADYIRPYWIAVHIALDRSVQIPI